MMISVVIPVFNSETSLEELYRRLRDVLTSSCDDFEIIMVDDCSRDQSFQVMQNLRAMDQRVKVIRLARNSGQHNATLCGFKYCRGDYIVTLDDDLQHPPEEIPVLLAKMAAGYDVVFGIPQVKQHHLIRNWGTLLIDKCISIIFPQHSDIKRSSFRLLDRKLIDRILNQPRYPIYMAALILINSLKPGNVEVRHENRKYGKSNYSLGTTINMTIILLVGYSTLPLQLISRVWKWLLVGTIILFIINSLKLWNSAALFPVANLLLISMAALGGISFYITEKYVKRLNMETQPPELPYMISEIEI